MHYSPWFTSGQWIEAPMWPALASGVLVALTAILALIAWGPTVRLGWKRALAPWAGALVGGVVGGLLGASAMLVSLAEPLLPGEAIPSPWAHALPLEITAALCVISGISVGLAVGSAIAGEGASRAVSLAPIGLGVVAMVPAIGWAGWLLSFGPVPLVRPDAARVHAGRTVLPTAHLEGNPSRTWGLQVTPPVTAPMTAGPLPADVVAVAGPLRTGVQCGVEVGLDTEDPRLPLAIGNQWTFGSSLEERITIAPLLLGVWDLGSKSNGTTVGLRVSAVHDDGPLRTRTVIGTDGVAREVVAWNGTSEFTDGSPVFSDDGNGDVRSALLPGWICQYGPPDPADPQHLTLPGPTGCKHEKGDAGAYIGSAIVGVATLGLLIPDPNPKGTLVPLTSGNVP